MDQLDGQELIAAGRLITPWRLLASFDFVDEHQWTVAGYAVRLVLFVGVGTLLGGYLGSLVIW
ncbi:hypothetical protein QJQ59_05940 (plasmid) [Klebsiella michiganensis]|nr:hypothetical protein QJQ59_01185 [Klebsiella michiganensis]WGZ97660.1 hypothetical protein QJQ59_05940 [Klebsiella michiganensis]